MKTAIRPQPNITATTTDDTDAPMTTVRAE